MIYNTNRSVIGGFIVILVVTGIVGCGDSSSESKGFTATVLDFFNKITVPGATAHAVDNSTAADLGISQVSDAYGKVAFDFSATPQKNDLVGFKDDSIVVGVTQYIETYKFNLKTTAKNAQIWLFDKVTFDQSVGLEDKAHQDMFFADLASGGYGTFGGRVYFVDSRGVETPVGCATVALSMSGVDTTELNKWLVYSTSQSFPAPFGPVDAAHPDAARNMTNPLSGDYSSGHIPPGTLHMVASVDGTPVGSADVIVLPATPNKYTFIVGNIYVDTPTNPTPSGCK
jgi:hypothetical protein